MAFSVLRMGKKPGLVVASRINPSAANVHSAPPQVKHQMATITQGLPGGENKQGLLGGEKTQGHPNGEDTQGLGHNGRLIQGFIFISVGTAIVICSDRKLKENREKEDEVWRKLFELHRERIGLGRDSNARETAGVVEAREGQKVYPSRALEHKMN